MNPQDLFSIFMIAFLLVVTWSLIAFGVIFYRRFRRGSIFPDRASVLVVHEELCVSGKSDKRRIGASNCLRVTFTNADLWVKPHFPISAFAERMDLEHCIPFENITSADFQGRELIIKFDDACGVENGLSLFLRSSDEEQRLLQDLMRGE